MKPVRYAYGLTGALLLGGAAATLTTGLPAGAQVAQNDDTQMSRVVPRAGAPESFATLTEQLAPAVVNISTRQRIEIPAQQNPFAGTPFEGLFGNRGGQGGQGQPRTQEAQSLGSGFIISADGFVVTNNHVVASPTGRGTVEEITVTMPDGTEYPARLVGADSASDLAVLKISTSKALPFVEFGNSAEARAGDWVVAIGNPFGLGGTVTSGIVSSVLRSTGAGAYDRYIQTDAAINRGNSGGPLFDMQGNVIGINNAIYSPSGGSVGIGFAIPAEIAAPIVEQLKAGREITRGYLGVSIQPIDDDLADSLGVAKGRGEFVQTVQPGEPGERAGIRPGDIVLTIDNKPITREQTLSFVVANIAPGTRVPIEIIRDGQRRNVTATIGRRPTDEALHQQQMFNDDQGAPSGPGAMGGNQPSSLIQERLGLAVVPLTPQIASQLGVAAGTQGVVITDVDQGSDAARKGLQRGFVVLGANNRDIANPAALEAAVRQAQAENRDALLLRVQARGGPARYVAVRLR